MPTIRVEVPDEASIEAIIKDLDTDGGSYAHSFIPTKVSKLAQPACKTTYVQSLGIIPKKGFRKHI